jgi:hypothetical protein
LLLPWRNFISFFLFLFSIPLYRGRLRGLLLLNRWFRESYVNT